LKTKHYAELSLLIRNVISDITEKKDKDFDGEIDSSYIWNIYHHISYLDSYELHGKLVRYLTEYQIEKSVRQILMKLRGNIL
jgi:hypothetical protein